MQDSDNIATHTILLQMGIVVIVLEAEKNVIVVQMLCILLQDK